MDRNMVLFFVLENVELLEPVLLALSRAGIRGATILDSTGAAKTVFAPVSYTHLRAHET